MFYKWFFYDISVKNTYARFTFRSHPVNDEFMGNIHKTEQNKSFCIRRFGQAHALRDEKEYQNKLQHDDIWGKWRHKAV